MAYKRDQQRRTSDHTVFSQLADAETFAEQCTGEISRRGIEQAPEGCAVQDGALWLQGFVDEHRHDAMRLLDFAHAAQYISQIGEEVRARGGHLPVVAPPPAPLRQRSPFNPWRGDPSKAFV